MRNTHHHSSQPIFCSQFWWLFIGVFQQIHHLIYSSNEGSLSIIYCRLCGDIYIYLSIRADCDIYAVNFCIFVFFCSSLYNLLCIFLSNQISDCLDHPFWNWFPIFFCQVAFAHTCYSDFYLDFWSYFFKCFLQRIKFYSFWQIFDPWVQLNISL